MPPTATAIPTQTMQGVEVPQSSVNPLAFFAGTRRNRLQQANQAWQGLGYTDTIRILRAGVVSEIMVQLTGTVTVNLAAGTVATTQRWPYDLMRACRFTANGQTNLINVSGAKLKAFEVIHHSRFTDKDTAQNGPGAYPGVATSQGTLSMNSEAWGLGSGVTAIPGAPTAYTFNLAWIVPIAYDQETLAGAIFAQTSSTALELNIDWAPQTDLFVTTGAATVVIAATLKVLVTSYSIPTDGKGGIVIPDLSAFHAVQQTKVTPTQGVNELILSGQGVGRQLMRVFLQGWNNTTQTPIAVTDANVGQFGIRYGNNDTPENLISGTIARQSAERNCNSDIAAFWGFLLMDFAQEFAFRDSIDEGTASEIRVILEYLAALPASASVEYVQETLASGVAA